MIKLEKHANNMILKLKREDFKMQEQIIQN